MNDIFFGPLDNTLSNSAAVSDHSGFFHYFQHTFIRFDCPGCHFTYSNPIKKIIADREPCLQPISLAPDGALTDQYTYISNGIRRVYMCVHIADMTQWGFYCHHRPKNMRTVDKRLPVLSARFQCMLFMALFTVTDYLRIVQPVHIGRRQELFGKRYYLQPLRLDYRCLCRCSFPVINKDRILM